MITKLINETINFATNIFQTDFTNKLKTQGIINYQINYVNYSVNQNFELYLSFYFKNANNEIIAKEEYQFQNGTMFEINKNFESANQKKYEAFVKNKKHENEL